VTLASGTALPDTSEEAHDGVVGDQSVVSCQDKHMYCSCCCCCGGGDDDWMGGIGNMTTATRLLSCWHCAAGGRGQMHHERVGGCQIKFAAKLKGGR
jgi:hypothetical protein